MAARMVFQFHGKDRARFNAVNRALVSLKNRNAKIPTANILTGPELVEVNDIIAKMNALLLVKVPV
jgi:hypothetical protein